MATLQGRAILSINDHPDIRRVFSRFKHRKLSTTYTIGGDKKPAGELLITTWK